MDILEHEIIFTETKSFGHKTFEYDFRTCTPKLSNQNKVFVRYSFVIGWFFFSRVQSLAQTFYDLKALTS